MFGLLAYPYSDFMQYKKTQERVVEKRMLLSKEIFKSFLVHSGRMCNYSSVDPDKGPRCFPLRLKMHA